MSRAAIARSGFLAVLFLCVAGAGHASRLGTDVVPTFQSIELKLDPAAEGYEGSVRIELEARARTTAFRLHAEQLRVNAGRLLSEGKERTVTVEPVGEDLLEVRVEPPLERGPHVLTIEFSGAYGDKSVGLYRVVSGGESYLFTQFQADDGRKAFPCFDEPAFKIPFRMTLTTPEDQMAISNTPPETETVADGRRTTVFEKTAPLPSYLLAIAVGPFDTVPIPGMSVPGRVVTPKGQSGLAGVAVEMTPPILAALERWFDSPHPYPKLDLIAVPEFWPGAMENVGAITYKERILLLERDQASVRALRQHARITAHELAHQWFGNLVTMEWWDDLWLNESFADWMGDKITEEVFPELRNQTAQMLDAQRFLRSDARPSTKPIRRPIHTADQLMEGVGLAYAKGRMVLGMFEGWMGEDVFRRGVLDYMKEHAGGSARADDLWKALDGASGADVSGALAGFLDQPGFPLVRVEPLGGGRVRLSQERFSVHGVDLEPLTWRVPLVLRWSDGGTARTRTFLLEEESAEVDLGLTADLEWIHPNGGGTGFYRWSVPREHIARLAAVSASALEPEERAELLGNAGALLDAAELDGAAYLETAGAFRDDPDPLVISAVVDAVDKVHGAFVTPDLEESFAAWVRATLGPALERIGLDRRPDEEEAVSTVRPQLLSTLADVGRSDELKEWCRGRAVEYLSDPASVDPSTASTALSVAAVNGDRDLYDQCFTELQDAGTPARRSTLIRGLASFRAPELREDFLGWAVEGLRPDEISALFGPIGSTEEGKDRLLRYSMENFESIAESAPPFMIAFFPFTGSGCSPERLETAREFFTHPDRAVPGTFSSLKRVEDQVSECVSLREREGGSVAAFLRSFARGPAGSSPHGGGRPGLR